MPLSALTPLFPDLIWLAIPVIMIAGFVHGTFGIGFPMVATPLLALFTDVLTAVLITLLPTISVNLATIAKGAGVNLLEVHRHIAIVPFTLLGTVIGTALLLWLDPRPFLLLLALAILLYLNQDRLQRLDLGWIRRRRLPAYILFGLAAGFMAGTVNVMAPILIMLFMELRVTATAMVVLFNLNFMTGKVTQSLIFLNQDIPGIQTLLMETLWLIPAALVSLFIGMQLQKRITETRYLKILRIILWAMAGILCFKFFQAYS